MSPKKTVPRNPDYTPNYVLLRSGGVASHRVRRVVLRRSCIQVSFGCQQMRRIHHINLVVPVLDGVVDRIAAVTGVAPRGVEYLEARGVALQRFDLDGTWLVLVAPTRPDSPAAAWLEQHGPGLFLLSFEADSLEAALDSLAEQGVAPAGPVRRGLDDWRVVDLDAEAFGGLPLQLTATGPQEPTDTE